MKKLKLGSLFDGIGAVPCMVYIMQGIIEQYGKGK